MVNKEGVIFAIAFASCALTAQHYLGFWPAIPFWISFVIIFYLFRDPMREIPSLPLAILSPADGKIIAIEKTHDPYVNRPAIKISIKMNSLGIYTTRSPTEGKVMQRWYKHPSESDKHKKNFGIWIQTDERDDVVLVMQPNSFLNTPKCFVQSGERIGQGRRCGYIRFGSNLEVYIPENSKILINIGNTVEAGSSVLANLIHAKDTINEKLMSA